MSEKKEALARPHPSAVPCSERLTVADAVHTPRERTQGAATQTQQEEWWSIYTRSRTLAQDKQEVNERGACEHNEEETSFVRVCMCVCVDTGVVGSVCVQCEWRVLCA